MPHKKVCCEICGEEIDPSACGQFLVRVNVENDTQFAETGKTERKRMILCETHSFQLSSWINEQALKHLEQTA